MSILYLTILVLIYLAIIAFLSYYAYRKTTTVADYLVGGRAIHPLIMALSYGSTFISTSAIVGFGGAAAVYGMGILWLTVLNIFVGIFIAFVYFGKRTRLMGFNLNAHTFPEFLGERFDSRLLQGLVGVVIVIGMPLYAGVVLMGGAQFIAEVLKVSYDSALFFLTAIVAIYVIMGGLKGVMYTDAFQGFLMFVGMTILLIFAYINVGGIVPGHQKLTDMADIAVKVFGAKGHTGWTSFPTFGSAFWWQLVTTIVMGVGIGVLAQPQLVVRFMTVKSDRELNRAVGAGGVFILMMTGVAFIVGALANVYFFNHPEFKSIAIVAAKKNVENIIPLFINTAMPPWFTGVFMITLLSAAMSTMSSQFHTMGAAIGRDIYQKWAGGKGKPIFITQIGILITIIIALFLAWGLPKFFMNAEMGTAIIARGTAIFFGLCASAFLPMYVGSLYSRKFTKSAAFSGFLVGFFVSLIWILFFHVKESQPLLLCKALFGLDSLVAGTTWAEVDPLIIALPLSVIATIVGNRFGKPLSQKHLDKCFKGIK
ncbi:MAG: sodium:solute symporter family protein [bacterium]|nr:sodium:solute symporter family protein [bacterium]